MLPEAIVTFNRASLEEGQCPCPHRQPLPASARLWFIVSPRKGYTHASFPGGGNASTQRGAIPPLPQATVACPRAPPVCYVSRRGNILVSTPEGSNA